ncbi:hypothetical protein E2C01_078134 [Portunus trituberculatus]|uniref:Uncharacterized protein n=1 Tax=Portunus trituberculatus TaxID=210409 RepID=A0A5B7IM36_PORTR|nr:hypothetical protein [Portunus trituberculatus]
MDFYTLHFSSCYILLVVLCSSPPAAFRPARDTRPQRLTSEGMSQSCEEAAGEGCWVRWPGRKARAGIFYRRLIESRSPGVSSSPNAVCRQQHGAERRQVSRGSVGTVRTGALHCENEREAGTKDCGDGGGRVRRRTENKSLR